MRLTAALKGNLEKEMQAELRDATHGAREGLRRGTDLLKKRLRTHTVRAGLGVRLAKAWRGKFYENDPGLNVAGFVWTKAQRILRGHTEGRIIRSKRSRFLAVPTENAPKRLGRRRVTPGNWPTQRLGPLRYVPRRSGPDLLVVDEARISAKTGRVSRAKRTKTGKMGRGAATVVMFLLLPAVRLKKRFHIEAVEGRVLSILPKLILRNYRTTHGQ